MKQPRPSTWSSPMLWAIIVNGTGVGTILNDDPPPVFSIGDATVLEGNSGTTSAVFNVTLTGATAVTGQVNIATASLTALPDLDYSSLTQTLIFQPGQTNRAVTVLVLGDTLTESDEAF